MKDHSTAHDRAHQRGKGDVGADLPMGTGHNTEESMGNSMPDTKKGDLETGFCDYGSIADACKSDPKDMDAGRNNHNSKV